MRRALPIALLLASACVPERSFPNRFGNAYCRWSEKCDPEFEHLLGDLEQCRDIFGNDDLQEIFEPCDYDAGQAWDCIQYLRDARKDCSADVDGFEVDDPCDHVYTCPTPE